MNLKQQLATIALEFKTASDQKNWAELERLDADLKISVERFVAQTKSDEDRKQLAHFLERIQIIYRLVTAGAEKHREEIAKELTQLSREQKAVASYQNSKKL